MKNKTTIKSMIAIMAFSFAAATTSCKKDKDVAPVSSAYEAAISPVKEDETIARIKGNGHTVFFLGDKNAQGLPTKINQVISYKDGEETPTIIDVDAQNRPTQIKTNKGVSMEFSWLADKKSRVHLISPNNEREATLELDFNQISGLRKANPNTEKINKRVGKNILVSQKEIEASSNNRLANSSIANNTSNPLLVAIKACSGNVVENNIKPFVELRYDISTQATPEMVLRPTGINASNEYVFSVPNVRDGIISTEDFCKPVAKALADFINAMAKSAVLDGDITTLNLLIDDRNKTSFIDIQLRNAGFVNSANGQPIIDGKQFIDAMIGYAQVFGTNGLSENADAFAANFCTNTVNLIDGLPEKYSLKTKVFFPTEGLKTKEQALVSTDGPFAKVDFDLPVVATILGFRTSPNNPAPEEDYVAAASIRCANRQAFTIKITGTDGFEDSVSGTISGNNQTISIDVPGGDAGVDDIITITVGNVTKTIGITF